MAIAHPACASSSPDRPRFEVGQVVREHGDTLRSRCRLGPEQIEALRAMGLCRTPALGGHLDVCQRCDYSKPSYNSCRNRHCPKCQALAQHRWIEQRMQRILPVHHFHVVFTLPAELRPVVLNNRRCLYELIFSAAARALLELTADEARLGAQIGMSAVLHTWSRDLSFHPHLHCVVTGGGLSPDGEAWVATRPKFLLPECVLGAAFRGRFLSGLRNLHAKGKLELRGTCSDLQDPDAFRALLDKLWRRRWVTYTKRPFGDAEAVYGYLGRYTHRIAISNRRIESFDGERVTFRTRGDKRVTLTGPEFLRRLMLHVLPKGFVRIRHYGLLAPANVSSKLEVARGLLAPRNSAEQNLEQEPARPEGSDDDDGYVAVLRELTGLDLAMCPACHTRAMIRCPLDQRERAPP